MDQKHSQRVESRARFAQQPASRPDDTSISAQAAESGSGFPPGDGAVEMQGVYIISVAARILDMHPQTLRKYERLGLISPGRTMGMLRLYSTEDIRRLRLIRHLSDEMGLNLAGVEFALATVQNLVTLKKRLAARLDDAQALQAVEAELELLFQSLNLPLDV